MFPNDDQHNPYSPSYSEKVPAQPTVRDRGEIIPTQVDADDVLSYAWQQFKLHWGPLVGAFFVTMVISGGVWFASVVVQVLVEGLPNLQQQPGNPNPMGPNVNSFTPLGIGLSLMQQAVSIFLGIGMTRMSLAAGRDETPSLEQLFSGGPWFFPLIGFSILYVIALIVGFVLLIIPFFILLFMWWPARFVLIDGRAGVMDSFGLAARISKGNWLTAFVLWLATIGVSIVGFMLCGVGLIFAIPFVQLILVCGYLMMSGQVGRVAVLSEPTDYGFES